MNEITRITFDRIDTGFYQILDQEGRQVGLIEQSYYGRHLWSLDLGKGRVVDGSSDCFSLAISKQIAKKRLLCSAALKAFKLHDTDGEGASTIGIYLGVPTGTANALINLGREIAWEKFDRRTR